MTAEAQLILYGVLVSGMTIAAWASKDHVVQKLALLMLAAWTLSNLALAAVGYGREPMLVPTLDAIVAAFVGYVGFANRSRLALTVFALFGLLGMIHVGAFIAHRTESYYYYAAKNATFLVQVFTVGGSGAWMALRAGLRARGERVSPHIVRSR